MGIISFLVPIGLILFGLSVLYVSFSYPGRFGSLTNMNHTGLLDTVILGGGCLLLGAVNLLYHIPKQIVIAGTLFLIGVMLFRHCSLAKEQEKTIDTANMNWTLSMIGGIVSVLLGICNIINYIF